MYKYKFLEAESMIRTVFFGMIIASCFVVVLYFHVLLNPFSWRNLYYGVERGVPGRPLEILEKLQGGDDSEFGVQYLLGKAAVMCVP